MVFVNPGDGPLPPLMGDASPAAAPSSPQPAREFPKEKKGRNGADDDEVEKPVSNWPFVWVFLLLCVTVVVIAGFVTWALTHDAPSQARQLAFTEKVTVSSTGLVNRTHIALCNNFQSEAPNDLSVSPQCADLAVGAYLERLDIAFDNTSSNTYKEVTVCGALIVQNDNGAGNPGEIARDNCVQFFKVGYGWTYYSEVVGGLLGFSTHVEIVDFTGFATVNYHQISGLATAGDTPGSRYCNLPGVVQPCA